MPNNDFTNLHIVVYNLQRIQGVIYFLTEKACVCAFLSYLFDLQFVEKFSRLQCIDPQIVRIYKIPVDLFYGHHSR